jgi:hypothetical protein
MTVPSWVENANEVGSAGVESYGTWPDRDRGETWPDRWSSGGQVGDWIAGTVKLYVPGLPTKFDKPDEDPAPVAILTDCTGTHGGQPITGDWQIFGSNKALRSGFGEADPRPGDRMYFLLEAEIPTDKGNAFKRYVVKHDPSGRPTNGQAAAVVGAGAVSDDDF